MTAPIVNTIERTTGKASGIEATARAIEVENTEVIELIENSPELINPNTKVNKTIPADIFISVLVSFFTVSCNGDDFIPSSFIN